MVETVVAKRQKAGGCVRLTLTASEWLEVLELFRRGRVSPGLVTKLTRIERARQQRDGEQYPGEAG